MYGKSSRSKKPEDSINTLNCSSMDTWNTGNSLKKPANGWENGFNSYGNAPNVDPRMAAIPNTAGAEQTMQYLSYMQYMQVMQIKAAAAFNSNPLGMRLNPLENLPNATAPSYSLSAQMSGLPPGRPRSLVDDPRIYSAGRSDGSGRRDNQTTNTGSHQMQGAVTKSNLTYGEYKRQKAMLNNPNMNGNSQNDDGWDDEPRSSGSKQSSAPPVDDWDDEPTPSVKKSYAAPSDDWDEAPRSYKVQKPNAPPVDDWDDEPTPSKMQIRKPHGDPWDEPSSSSVSKRSNAAPKDNWDDDERVVQKKPVDDDWDDEPTPQTSRSFSHARSAEPVDDWEDAQPAPSGSRGRDSYNSNARGRDSYNDRGSYRGRGGNRGGGGGYKQIEKREGDWDCKDCGNTNFKWRKECQKCGTAGGNPEFHARSSRGGFIRGRDRFNRGSSRESSQSSDHQASTKDDWDDEGSVQSNGSNGRRGGFNYNKRRHDDLNRGQSKRYDTQSLGDDWDEEPIKAKASKMPPVPVDDWDEEPAPKKRASSKNDDWDDDKGPRSPSPERNRRRRRASPSDNKLKRLEIELKLQRLENERLKLAFSGRRLGMTPSPPRSSSSEYEPASRRRRHSPKQDTDKWESRRYKEPPVESSSSLSSYRRRPQEDDNKSQGGSSSKSSSYKLRFSERVEPEIMIAKPSDTHIMMRGSVTSAALPQHELKKLPNYAHLYNLPPHENQPKEENVSPVSMIQAKKDKKSRWSNQPARKVEVVALDQENWDDVDIAESESPKKSIEKSTEVKEIEDDNWDEEKLPVDIKKETISSFDNIKSPSETSEMKDTWDDDYKLPAADEKTQDPCNQGPKKIDADFLGQQIAVQIEKIRHRQAILVQQHLNTQVLLGNPPISTSPPIIIEKLGPNTVDDMYDVSMPPPVIISADAIISSDISPIDSVILAQAIQITNKARGFESIALAPVTNIKPFVVAPTTPEIIDLDDVAEVRFDSREGIEVSRPTYGILRKKTPNQVKQIKLQSKMEENWDDDDEESEPPQKVDFNTLSSVLKSSELLQAVSEDENWDDEQDEIIKKKEKEDIKNREREAKARKHEEKSRKNIEKSLKSRNGRKSPDNDNWDEENSNQAYQQVDPDILARHMAKVAAKSFKNNQRNTTSGIPNIPRSNKNKPKVDPIDEENWDDDPELEAVSKELIDPEILAKNVALHNSMDLQTKLSISNKIVPLEDTSESFRKEFGNTSKHREKNNVIKALSSLSTSVASIPVTAAVAAYALQKRKLIEQIYEYHPRRESIDVRKHVDSYSYLPEYAVPVDYGRVPQSHPTHYQTSYDYSSYYKALYTLPKEKSYLPVTKKPKKRELITEIPLKKKKTAVEVVKKIRLEVNAEDLSDGEIVDSDEDFGSDLSSVNDDDDVIEIPVKVDLVDLTEEEIAAAVKEETETVDIKKEYGNTELNPPLPTEKIEIPKELIEAEDSPESPVNMEVNQDPEEWHDEPKEINQQEYSPTSPVNMNVNEEYENNKINQNQESEVVKDSLDDKSSQKEIVETLMKYPETTVEVVEAHHVPNPSKESEATTDTNIAKPEAIQECQLDNKIEDSSPSPVNNETEIIKEQCNILTEVSEVESFSVSTHEDKVIDETSNNEANESPDEMNATSPDSPVRALSDEPSKTLLEDSEQIGQEISPSSPVNINCSDNEAKPKQNNSDKTPVSIIITDPVEVQVEKLPEQPIGTLSNTGEPVTKDSLIEETVMKNHETPKIDAQQIEDGIQESSKIDDDASESCSTINDEDILLDDDELEATTLFLSNEQEKVPEAIVTTSVSNEIEEASVEVHVQKETVVINTSSNTANARFNPYILIKKEKIEDFSRTLVKVPTPVEIDSDIEEVPVTETPATNRRSNRIRQTLKKFDE